MAKNVQIGTHTSDGAVSTNPGKVYWVVAIAGAAGGLWQLNDSDDDSGTDKLTGTIPANDLRFLDFSAAPIDFENGIYADIPGTNVTLTIAYDA